NWQRGTKVRLLGVHVSGFDALAASASFDFDGAERWKQALSAADRLRDKYGESAVHMGSALKADIRERTHEAMPEAPGLSKDKKSGIPLAWLNRTLTEFIQNFVLLYNREKQASFD